MDNSIYIKFHNLAEQWKKETQTSSSITRSIANGNHLKIIAMGPAVIPLILKELQGSNPYFWFPALMALSEDGPTTKTSYFEEAVKLWLEWGVNKGLIEKESE